MFLFLKNKTRQNKDLLVVPDKYGLDMVYKAPHQSDNIQP